MQTQHVQETCTGTCVHIPMQGESRLPSARSRTEGTVCRAGSAMPSPRLPSSELAFPSPRARRVSMPPLPAPLAILPHHLRPAPHDGLRVLYLDHLEVGASTCICVFEGVHVCACARLERSKHVYVCFCMRMFLRV